VEQGKDDPVGRGVHGDCQAEPDARDGRVDADDTAVRVGQRTAGAARVQRGVGLDDVLDQSGGRAAAGGDAAAERTDDAGGHAAGQPERVTHGDHELTDTETVGVAVLRRVGDAPVGAQDREVRQRIATDHVDAGGRTVRERRLTRRRPAHDVGVGDEVALGRQHDPGPGRLAVTAAEAQRSHPRRQGLGDLDHDRGVGVERFARDLVHTDRNVAPDRRVSAFAVGGTPDLPLLG